MSYYVYGTGISYLQYLQAKSFVDDATGATREAGHRVAMRVSQQTRDLVASNAALARENIRVGERLLLAIEDSADRVSDTLSKGFDRLSYDLQDISSGISELNSTFHWGFGEMIAAVGHMQDALSELIKIAKTPVQTVAFNHFEIARDAFRQRLFKEAIDELNKAISGDHTSSGYTLEWRFHQMLGTIRLGFADCDVSLVDLAQAEEAFLLAARYARSDYPEDAACAFLAAGWAAYCQGKMQQALRNTEQAIAVHPRLGEAFFQAAKVRMASGDPEMALPVLAKAIDLDHGYALKAAGDGDFHRYDARVREFLQALRQQKFWQSAEQARALIRKCQFWTTHFEQAAHDCDLRRVVEFEHAAAKLPLLDLLGAVDALKRSMVAVEARLNSSITIMPAIRRDSWSYEDHENWEEEETYQEEVLIRSRGLFRKASFAVQTKSRKVPRSRIVTRSLPVISDGIYSATGALLTSVEFRSAPFVKWPGDGVTVARNVCLARHLVTQGQWRAVMGEPESGRFTGDANSPVEVLSSECEEFIARLNDLSKAHSYRLSSAAEWECPWPTEAPQPEYTWVDYGHGILAFRSDRRTDGHNIKFSTSGCRAGFRLLRQVSKPES